jgi:NADH-ubiquinone oxidoreductase chain 3
MTSFTFFLFFIPVLSVILLAINFIFAPYNPNAEKRTAFECGFHSFLGQNRSQFSISFFIFGLLFLLFDLEILLIYPYALSSNWNDLFGLLTMLLFFILLTVGFIFELGKKALTIYSRQNNINGSFNSKTIDSKIKNLNNVNIIKSHFSFSTILVSSYIVLDNVNVSLSNFINEFTFQDFIFSFIFFSILLFLILVNNSFILFTFAYKNINKIFFIYFSILCLYISINLLNIILLAFDDLLFMAPPGNSDSVDGGAQNPSSPTGEDSSSSDSDDDDEDDSSLCPHHESMVYHPSSGESCDWCLGLNPRVACIKCLTPYHDTCLDQRTTNFYREHPDIYDRPEDSHTENPNGNSTEGEETDVAVQSESSVDEQAEASNTNKRKLDDDDLEESNSKKPKSN